jgi:seryl-tRNA synthetase
MKKSKYGYTAQAKESADEIIAERTKVLEQIETMKKESKEFELKMRAKASTVGNIVGKEVPVSLTEVRASFVEVLHPWQALSLRFS